MKSQLGALVALCLLTVALSGSTVGPEVPVEDAGAGSTPAVALSRDFSRTLMTWDESAGPGQLSKVMLHRHESRPGFTPPLGPQTFPVASSPYAQKTPALGDGLVAWVEDEPTGSGIIGSIWYQPLEFWQNQTYAPFGQAERLGYGTRGTTVTVLHYHVFHAAVWTGLNGRLEAAERSLLARIGYDPTPWQVTNDLAIHPAGDGQSASASSWPLIAYLNEVPQSPPCSTCPRRYILRATTLGGRVPQPAIYLSAPGISAEPPDVVANGVDNTVFWSMESGGTFGIRVKTVDNKAEPVGNLKKVHDGQLHDASSAPNNEMVMVVKDGERFLFLRLDRDLNILESVPFTASLAAGARMKISAAPSIGPMISYAAATGVDGQGSRIVYRLVEDAPSFRKRRSAR